MRSSPLSGLTDKSISKLGMLTSTVWMNGSQLHNSNLIRNYIYIHIHIHIHSVRESYNNNYSNNIKHWICWMLYNSNWWLPSPAYRYLLQQRAIGQSSISHPISIQPLFPIPLQIADPHLISIALIPVVYDDMMIWCTMMEEEVRMVIC